MTSRLLLLIVLALLCVALCPARGGLPLVSHGRPEAVIVTAERATPTVTYAAMELNGHLEKATRTNLLVVPEGHVPAAFPTHIYLGDCKAARAQGIMAAEMDEESFVIRTRGHHIYIVGNDDARGGPLHRRGSCGTYFGVCEFLERVLQVRWLWPGELGTFVPRRRSVTAEAMDFEWKPLLLYREIRTSGAGGDASRGFLPAAAAQRNRELEVFLRRHAMGGKVQPRASHSFGGWWKRYGQEHPEWFQLVDGQRGPHATDWSPHDYSMCVSNRDLHKEIVNRWLERRSKQRNPDLIACGENDTRGGCECESCRDWDGPQDRYHPRLVGGDRIVSGRYARFWQSVQELAMKTVPTARVTGYAYANYLPAPPPDVRLHENIIVGFVPDVLFPRSDRDQAWVRQQWSGWKRAGADLYLRPNYFNDGYCMPHIFAHQFADEFRHAFTNGMFATDFDTIKGHWGVQGPNLYVLMRLHSAPLKDVDEILDEYYTGFGPAAETVKAYFEYWEQHALDAVGQRPEMWRRRGSFGWRYPKVAHELFPPTCFVHAQALLATAQKQAADTPEFRDRIAFLKTGLDHARLAVAATTVRAGDRDATTPAARDAMKALWDFRVAHQWSNAFNANRCDWVERRSWRVK